MYALGTGLEIVPDASHPPWVAVQWLSTARDRSCGFFLMGIGVVVDVVSEPPVDVVVFDDELEPEHPANVRAAQSTTAETIPNDRFIC